MQTQTESQAGKLNIKLTKSTLPQLTISINNMEQYLAQVLQIERQVTEPLQVGQVESPASQPAFQCGPARVPSCLRAADTTVVGQVTPSREAKLLLSKLLPKK